MSKLMAVDGNSIINRAFYGIPILTDKNGEYTNAVYGFLNIFFKMLDDESPDLVAVAFDLKAPTFRHKMYAEYKGTRHGMPEELVPQVPMLKEILRAMNIAVYEKEGYEADDILGTLAKRAEKEGMDAVIVSGDRDLLQIATDKIKIKIPKTKGGKTISEEYFAKDVKELYGVTPEEFIDVKALMGDTSDNVPGVPSIGEKTAIKIITNFSNIDNALLHAAEIKPKKASENILLYREQLLLSKKLVTIDTAVPIDFDTLNLTIKDMYNPTVMNLFEQHGFKSFISRFVAESQDTKTIDKAFDRIDDPIKAESFIDSLNPWGESAFFLVCDETDILGIAVSDDEKDGTYIDLTEMNKNSAESVLKKYFEGENTHVCHNKKKALTFLKKYNITPKNIDSDIFIAAYLINSSGDYSINELAYSYLSESLSFTDDLKSGKKSLKITQLTADETVKFACERSYAISRLKAPLSSKLEELGLSDIYKDMEFPLIDVLFDMECAGMYVDKEDLIKYRDDLEELIENLTKEIYWCAGEEFNINSPKQLGTILFDKLGLSGGKKTKTGWSTAADVLESLADKDEIVKKILDYRTYAKLKSTYADGLLAVRNEETGRVYSTFNQAATATGRISSTEPNLQNIPIKLELGHKLRKAFKAVEGCTFIDADYSQIELRVLAHMANEELLINSFKEGADIHTLTATQVFGADPDSVTPIQRRMAKIVNFGILYGKQGFSLSKDLGIPKKEADIYIEQYFAKYRKVRKFLDDTIAEAKSTGCTKTLFGRIRPIPDINSKNFQIRSAAERMAMNMPIQGTAADIIKIAMIKLYNRLQKEGLSSKLILQVHDELLIEAPDSEKDYVEKILKEEMENAVSLKVPLDVDIHTGKTWYEAK